MTISCTLWRSSALGYRPIIIPTPFSLVGSGLCLLDTAFFDVHAVVPDYLRVQTPATSQENARKI